MKLMRKPIVLILTVIMLIPAFPVSFAASIQNTASDEVSYNLGSMEVTVGYDKDMAKELPGYYNLFNEDGSYVIRLEDNAFFPYEVQFTGESGVETRWFETPESIVEFEGHVFSVESVKNDPGKLAQENIL